MNTLSINIRGLGGVDKSTWIRGLRIANEVGFLMVQETQFTSVDGLDLGLFWGNGAYEFDWVGSTGRSGGLLSIWNPKRFVMASVIKHRYFLCVRGNLKDSGKEISFINVYFGMS